MAIYIATVTDMRNHVLDRCGNYAPADVDALTAAVLDLAAAHGYRLSMRPNWEPFFEALNDETFFALDGYMPSAE